MSVPFKPVRTLNFFSAATTDEGCAWLTWDCSAPAAPHGGLAVQAVALRGRAHSFTASQVHSFTGAGRTGDWPSGQPRCAQQYTVHSPQKAGLAEFVKLTEPLIW